MSEDTEAKETATSHDLIWKVVLHLFLADLIRLVSPKLAAILELDPAEVEFLDKETFTDFPQGDVVRADLVAKTSTTQGGPHIVLLHYEVEGEFRNSIDERILRYSMHLRLKYHCSVVSVVLFLSGGPKGVKTRVVIDQVGEMEVYRFSYLVLGLSGSLAENWIKRPEPLAAALAALMGSKIWDRVEKKLECLRAIQRAEIDEARRFALVNVVGTYIDLEGEEARRFDEALRQEQNKEILEAQMTWAQKLEAKGEAKGEVIGTRRAIELLWRHRLGPLLEDDQRKLQAIDDLPRLYEVLEQVSSARSGEKIAL